MRTLGLLFAASVTATALAAAAPLHASDGALDATWGGDGVSAGYPSSQPWAGAVDQRQRYLITGDIGTLDRSEIETVTNISDGASLWEGCINGVAFLDNFVMRQAIFDSSNRLLLAGVTTVFGSETTERAFIARFTAEDPCTFDTTFSGSGWEYFDLPSFCDTEDCRLVDVAESADPTTRYVALLESVVNGLRSDYYLVGLTAAGDLDLNFSSDGFAPVTGPNLGLLAGGGARLVVDSASRIYVLHSYYDPVAALDLDAGLTRFQSNGALDTTFADSGSFLINADNEDTLPRALVIGPDGRLGFAVYGLTASSSILGALQITNSGAAFFEVAGRDTQALAFDGLGRLLYTYDLPASDGMGVERLLVNFGSGMSADPAFTPLALDIDDGGNTGERPVDIATPAGRPMILVDVDQVGGGSRATLVRLENSLIFADGFEWGSTKFW